MTAAELKINALVLIEIGSPEEQEEGRNTLRMLRDGLYPEPVLEDTVDKLMEELNLTEGWRDVQIIRTALIQAYHSPRLLDCVSRELYKVLGEIYHASPAEVGRCISRGIERIYKRGDPRKLDAFFKYRLSDITGKPTPVNFLRRCLKELRERMEVTVCW